MESGNVLEDVLKIVNTPGFRAWYNAISRLFLLGVPIIFESSTSPEKIALLTLLFLAFDFIILANDSSGKPSVGQAKQSRQSRSAGWDAAQILVTAGLMIASISHGGMHMVSWLFSWWLVQLGTNAMSFTVETWGWDLDQQQLLQIGIVLFMFVHALYFPSRGKSIRDVMSEAPPYTYFATVALFLAKSLMDGMTSFTWIAKNVNAPRLGLFLMLLTLVQLIMLW
jgi:hypothetical protein